MITFVTDPFRLYWPTNSAALGGHRLQRKAGRSHARPFDIDYCFFSTSNTATCARVLIKADKRSASGAVMSMGTMI